MKILLFFSGLIFTFLIASCSVVVPGGLINSTTPIPQQKYEVLGEAEGKETSTSFLFFRLNKPNKDFIERACKKAINKLGGDELINVAWYHKYSNYFLWRTYSFSVQGIVVKKGEAVGSLRPQIPKPLIPTETMPPMFDGIGFFLALSKGTHNEYAFFDEPVGGFNSVRWNFYLKNRSRFIYVYPQISYAKLSKDSKEKLKYGGWEKEVRIKGYIRTIPITCNIGINGAKHVQLSENLPEQLNPYANIGLGYYITEFGDDAGGDWKWNGFGYNFGLGVEFAVNPTVSVSAGFNRHSVFTGTNYTYWDWSVGIIYYMKD